MATMSDAIRSSAVFVGDGLMIASEMAAAVKTAIAALPADAGFVALKKSLIDETDRQAELVRQNYITPGSGQALTYQAKAAQAKSCLADAAPDAASYPLLAAEIGITAADLLGVATAIDAANTQWLLIGSQIEATRLGAKKSINAALTAAAAKSIFDAITWPV